MDGEALTTVLKDISNDTTSPFRHALIISDNTKALPLPPCYAGSFSCICARPSTVRGQLFPSRFPESELFPAQTIKTRWGVL